ncbi:MAG: hypothetical protein J7501_06410 [Bdellovibrio sp.]|nr:hypothetical protein [Bdellovibrio sp.]
MEQNEKKKLLIIKSHPQSLGPVESFLKNRDWIIKSTANLKEALVYLVQSQPQFVMISIDHPNKKVRNLPKVLSQAMPICVIAFAENSTSASIKILSDCAAGYAIFHPLTGPAVERMVNKYYKDQLANPGGLANRGVWNEAGSASASGVIAIRGESSAGDASSTSQSLLASLMGGLETGTLSGGMTPVGMSATQNTEGNFVPSSMDPTGGPNHLMNGLGTGAAPDSMSALSTGKPFFENDNSGTEISDEVAKAPDSLILKGTREAMENACINLEKTHQTRINTATNVSCILVESARFSGYLIAAMAPGHTIDRKFIEKIRGRLFRFLRVNGERIEDNESMPIRIKPVPFVAWTAECAEFLRKSVHDGNEVAMAFFPRKDIKAQVELSGDEEMAAFSIGELEANVPVDFNVYIYLPRNNRYVLYTPCGGIFFSEQKQRLINQGVSHLHVLRLELSELDKYRAQNFLNDTIQEFEAKEREKFPS